MRRARTEETLAEQHTAVKRQRQQIEQRLLVLETTKSMCPPAADLARRREERTLRAEHAQVETERQRCFAHLSQANEKRLAAADAYREMQEEAGRWLRRMRSAPPGGADLAACLGAGRCAGRSAAGRRAARRR